MNSIRTNSTIQASQWYHTCGLSATGSAFCWGDNEFGALGNGGVDDSFVPAAVSGLDGGVIAVSTGSLHTCAVTAAGMVKCWGSNDTGQLGDGTTIASNVPVDVVLPIAQDTTAPSIIISSPTAATYLLNQPVAAAYTCDDGFGIQSGIAIALNNSTIPPLLAHVTDHLAR